MNKKEDDLSRAERATVKHPIYKEGRNSEEGGVHEATLSFLEKALKKQLVHQHQSYLDLTFLRPTRNTDGNSAIEFGSSAFFM
jgi:hypothetical protein